MLLLIAESLPNQQDLSAFVQTTKRTYITLQHCLYKNNVKNNGSSALLWAAEHGDTALTQTMLDAGASIRGFDSFFCTPSPAPLTYRAGNPILLAASGSHIETLTCLLAETRSGQGWIPDQLCEALHNGAIPARSGEAVKLLIRYNVPLDGVDGMPRYRCCRRYIDIIPFLLEAGACIDENEIPTTLENAVLMKQPEAVEMLLGAEVWLEDDELMCIIAHQGSLRMLEAFLEAGFEVGRCWQRAISVAVVHGKTEIVARLIEKRSNSHLITDMLMIDWDNLQYGTIGFAVHFGHLEVLKLLLEKGVRAEWSDLILAPKVRFEEAVALLEECDFEDVPWKEMACCFLERKLRGRKVTELRYKGLRVKNALFGPVLVADDMDAPLFRPTVRSDSPHELAPIYWA
ncbi:hypothetical protein N7463_010745 [Penicillium fimorum]|uniref:Ankyrin n=1 Tax=Penicillium fimorum TaxID=1882269 RepID=A0A9W9XKH6_9EURO|nr:hypothetical protein N7463_010745 [Penicillium fimorum]